MSEPRGVAEYAAALLALLPRGRVWPREAGTVQAQTAAAMVPAWVRSEARARALLADAFPASAQELLPDWEASLGLPDPCAGVQPTMELRRLAVHSRLTARGGQSVSYFVEVAAALGYAVTVEEFLPFRFGQPFGRPLAGSAWAHAWRVRVAGSTVRPFRFGVSKMGEPFATWGGKELECALRAAAPAHAILIFAYEDAAAVDTGADLDDFMLDVNTLS